MVRIDVFVSPELAASLSSGAATSAALEAQSLAARFGAQLVATHPGINDQELRRYYHLDIPTPESAEKLRTELLNLPGIEGAFIKPLAELP